MTNVEGREATLTVSKTLFNQETDVEKKLTIRPFATTPAKVMVKLGRTINLGNYESARIDVAFEVPCYAEEIVPVYHKTLELVSEKITSEIESIGKSVSHVSTVEELL